MSARATLRLAQRTWAAIGRDRRTLLLLVVAALALGAGAVGRAPAQGVGPAAARQAADSFPHARHARLFPTCAGCHAGIAADDRAGAYPDSASCTECHDGREQRVVAWRGPRVAPSNLRFSHAEHARESGGPGADCAACHQQASATRAAAMPAAAGDTARAGAAGAPGSDRRRSTHPRTAGWMQVGRARPATCLACHGHRASAHLAADNACEACHVPLVEARALSVARVARFPQPPSHARPDFVARHAPADRAALAQCAVCHAQESCARCHPNAGAVRQIAALGRDARAATLAAGRAGAYPVPASHRAPDFREAHGDRARRGTTGCANCHAQEGCRSCHLGESARETIARLPDPAPGAAAGVRLRAAGEPRPRLGDAVGDPRPGASGVDPGPAPPAAAEQASVLPPRGGAPPRGGPSADAPGPAPTWPDAPIDTGAAPRDGGPSGSPPPRRPSGVHADTGARPVRVHWANYARNHGAEAAARRLDCTGCHGQRFCAECHGGEARRQFHPANFAQRHAADAWGRERDCAQCHNTEAFCRSCHEQSGFASRGRLDVAYHTAQPLWLLQHGRAARQSLQSCASCHQQRDCMQCHSTLGWGVNPHGRGFDAARVATRNRLTCLRCHLSDPLAAR